MDNSNQGDQGGMGGNTYTPPAPQAPADESPVTPPAEGPAPLGDQPTSLGDQPTSEPTPTTPAEGTGEEQGGGVPGGAPVV